MKFKSLHPNFKLPTKGTALAGAYDIYMPENGRLKPGQKARVPLGFSAEVPESHVALVLPRSSWGIRGLVLQNTCAVIDSDYRGEWIANLLWIDRLDEAWQQGDRLLQMLIVPVANVTPELAEELSETDRGAGGFGSTGK